MADPKDVPVSHARSLDGRASDDQGRQMADHLARHDVNVEAMPAPDIHVASAILSYALIAQQV